MRFHVWKFGLMIGRLIFRLKFRWFDLWIGAYYDREHGIWYLILIPTLVLEVQLIPRYPWKLGAIMGALTDDRAT